MAALPSLVPLQEITLRRNASRSIDVVCLNCLATVGTAIHKEDLLLIEEAHPCEPSLLVEAMNHCWSC